MTEDRKRTVTIITIVASLILPWVVLSMPSILTVSSAALYFSAVIGYMGIMLMLWMYILGTRAVTGLLFTDIAPVLAIHKWLGKFATPMIFLHPLLITISYGEGWLYSVIPKISTLIERHVLLGQIALAILGFTWLVSAFLRGKIAFRPWKYLHYLAYICIPFALLHVPDLGSQEQTSLLVKMYFLSLVIVFIGFSILRLRSLVNLDKSEYTVDSLRKLNDTDAILTVLPKANITIKPAPGQYVYIKLGYISEDHPFSVLWHDTSTGALTLGFRATGMYTKELRKLDSGATVYMSGPYGSFTQEISLSNNTEPVFIAGGIGVTPFIQHLFTHPSSILIYANRNKASSILYPELRKQLGKNMHALFNDEGSRNSAYEYLGYVSSDLIGEVVPVPVEKHYYICGPPAMMEAVQDELALLGVPARNVHIEEFGW